MDEDQDGMPKRLLKPVGRFVPLGGDAPVACQSSTVAKDVVRQVSLLLYGLPAQD
jgi:hypothetical protein